MTAPTESPPAPENIADLLARLGDIPPARVRLNPSPGDATRQDVLDVHRRTKRLCELVDGVLVEKGMDYRESVLAIVLAQFLGPFIRRHNLGVLAGESGMLGLAEGLVRIPDVSFVSWDRLPDGRVPKEPIPDLVPDLAVEVLSLSNTKAEMARKRREYFAAGVSQVWQVDPVDLTVTVYTAPEQSTVHPESAVLSGGDVLPGFTLPLRDLFAELDRRSPGR